MSHEPDPTLLADYEKTITYFQLLHDTRFKIMAVLPILAGAGLATLSDLTDEARIVLGALGALVTLGLISYDSRNTDIHDRLIMRAQFLEELLRFPELSGVCKDEVGDERFGGPFRSRPPLRRLGSKRRHIYLVWHTLGLALVYGASLSTWTFFLVDGLSTDCSLLLWVPLAVLVASVATTILLAQHGHKQREAIKEHRGKFGIPERGA